MRLLSLERGYAALYSPRRTPRRGGGRGMKGYDVRTIDDDKVGHVVGVEDDFVIVEHGLLKTKHALPMTFAEVDDEQQLVRTTLSKSLIHDSPKVNGDIDHQAIAEHYGLAEGFTDPMTRGAGDMLPDDPAYGSDDGTQEKVTVRNAMTTGEGPLDEPPPSPGVTGGDRRRDYPTG